MSSKVRIQITDNEYDFISDDCIVHFIPNYKNRESYIYISDFYCKKEHQKGNGRKLLLTGLEYFTDKGVRTFGLNAVPHIKKEKNELFTPEKRALALEKLKKYYISLGFIESGPDDYFEGDIDNIITNIKNFKGGRKTRKGNIKKTKNIKRRFTTLSFL